LARALSFLLLSTAAMASSFHDKTAIDLVSTGDIAADSKLGSMVLSQARQLNNNDNNYDMTWVSGYSIKFQQCTATHDYYGGYFNGNNNNNNNNNNRAGYNGIYEQRLVHFKLCPTDSCSSCENGADYVVDMATFVNAYTESKLSAQEYNCERVRESCYCQDNNNNNNNNGYSCEYYCYMNAGLDYCINNYNNNNNNNNKNQFNLQEALECRRLEVNQDALDYYYYSNQKNQNAYYQNYGNRNANQEFFVGPYCAKGGKKILLGVFMDETCSFAAPDGMYEKLNYGQKLPYSSESLVSTDCISCAEANDQNNQNNNDQQDQDNVLEVCQRVYEDAGKCETNLNIQYKNTYGCDFIKTLPKMSHWSVPTTNVASAKVLAGLFATTTVIFGGVVMYFQRKIRNSREADLAKYDLAWCRYMSVLKADFILTYGFTFVEDGII